MSSYCPHRKFGGWQTENLFQQRGHHGLPGKYALRRGILLVAAVTGEDAVATVGLRPLDSAGPDDGQSTKSSELTRLFVPPSAALLRHTDRGHAVHEEAAMTRYH